MKEILQTASDLRDELIQIRRELHKSPEVGPGLPVTKNYVMDRLRAYGYAPEEICESGITAHISGGTSERVILLRADMDALSIREKTELPFQAENGNMHACGHDMHTAMLLGAAKLLQQFKDRINGTVKLVFQPDEEGFTGAKAMLAAGVLHNPTVDAAMALHVHAGTPSGMVLCGKGVCMAGCTLFRIVVNGTGCHGAMPETGVDPINIAAHIHLALQTITAREIPAGQPALVTIGSFHAGEAPNIIPQQAVMEGSIRTMDRALTDKILESIRRIAAGTAQLFRGTAEVTEIASAPPLKNDEGMIEEVAAYCRELCGAEQVQVYSGGGMGSEDFSSYTYEIPCAYLLLGAGTAREDPAFGKPMHNEGVIFNEDILPLGAALYAGCAIGWLDSRQTEDE